MLNQFGVVVYNIVAPSSLEAYMLLRESQVRVRLLLSSFMAIYIYALNMMYRLCYVNSLASLLLAR